MRYTSVDFLLCRYQSVTEMAWFGFYLSPLVYVFSGSHNKTCWKNAKDLSNGAPKIKIWNYTQKRFFRFLPNIFASHGWSWIFFFANYQILGPLGCQGWVVLPQILKKSKITAPYCPFWLLPATACLPEGGGGGGRSLHTYKVWERNFDCLMFCRRRILSVIIWTLRFLFIRL